METPSTMTTKGSNQGALVIQLILSKIADGDNKAVKENLNRLPLGVIAKSQAETVLAWFLNQAVKSSNTEAVRVIIEAFDISRIRVDPLPAITNIFLNTSLSREVLIFTISCFPEKTSVDYYIDLINMGDDVTALKAAGIINTYFPDISHETWNTLFGLTEDVEEEEYENQLLREYFRVKLAESGTFSRRPDWVQTNLPESIIQPITEEIPTVKEAVDLLIADLQKKIVVSDNSSEDQKDFNIESELRETLISQYAISSVIEKIQMLAPVKPLPIINDIPLFQEFGPVNTIYTLRPSLIDPTDNCSKYGGCRMFLCNEFEQMYNDGDEIDIMTADDQINIDWFRRSCDKCLRKISKRHYAIRQPLRHGGWRGCYCSFECMEDDIDNSQTAVMVGRVKEQLSVIGIRDR